jgi:hypothetical protein
MHLPLRLNTHNALPASVNTRTKDLSHPEIHIKPSAEINDQLKKISGKALNFYFPKDRISQSISDVVNMATQSSQSFRKSTDDSL